MDRWALMKNGQSQQRNRLPSEVKGGREPVLLLLWDVREEGGELRGLA
jgi:hypothetical protein